MGGPLRYIATIALVLALGVAAPAADLATGRVYEALRVSARPVIDGKLTEACWQQAPKTGQFTRVIQGGAHIQDTLFQVAYDDTRLYIGVTCPEPRPEAIQAQIVADDTSAVMGDDAVEVFLRPDLAATTYYQLAANSRGVRYDGEGFNAAWNADWKAAAALGKDAWTLECAISCVSLGRYGVPGARWGFNVCRDRQAGGETEWSAWSDTLGQGFHAPERFGTLLFGGTEAGLSRGTLIEAARYAQISVELEGQLSEALGLLRGHGLDKLEPGERKRVQAGIAAADHSLADLRALLAGPTPLDVAAWIRVTRAMQQATEGVDAAAWDVRFATLLAD